MFRLILLLLLIGLGLAIRFLPWWALLGGAVAIVLSVKLLGGRLLLWLFHLPFRAKGAVLRGASAEVHSVRPAAAPERENLLGSRSSLEDEGDEDDGVSDVPSESRALVRTEADVPSPPSKPRDYYELEVTITPRQPTGPFTLWEAGELMLVRPGKKWDQDDDSCEVARLEVAQDGSFAPDEGLKYPGAQRLRMLIGVLPAVRKLAFQYYFEQFGEVIIPSADGKEA